MSNSNLELIKCSANVNKVTDTQINETNTEIVNEDELLANEDEDFSTKSITDNNEEELLDENNAGSKMVSSESIVIETGNYDINKFVANNNDVTSTIEPMITIEEENDLKFDSRNMKCEDIPTASALIEEDKELKNEFIEEIAVISKELATDLNKLNKTNDIECEVQTKLYCSTPFSNDKLRPKLYLEKLENSEFGSISPLVVGSGTIAKETTDLKRKVGNLASIMEEEEENDSSIAKRVKKEESECSLEVSKKNLLRKTLEPPAVSMLNKWLPSCLSRTTFTVCDQVGYESENEGDNYEDVYKSLHETLKSNSGLNGSTVHAEYQKYVLDIDYQDNKKFTEIMKELTQEMKDQFEDEDKFLESTDDDTIKENSIFESNNTLVPITSGEMSQLQPTENINQSVSCQILVEKQDTNTDLNELSSKPADKVEVDNNLSIIYSNVQDKNNDDEEEDMLLMEGEFDDKLKKKPHDLHFFISNDPSENSDNCSKEWDLLRKLSTDEERYKAVRERWRSLTIPDPKRDLTYRQWRLRNKLPSQQSYTIANTKTKDEPATRLCTALFDQNIDQILRRLEFKRAEAWRNLQNDLGFLATKQELQQYEMVKNRASWNEMYCLYERHIKEVNVMKERHDRKIRNEENVSQERIMSLKNASEEVLAFEKYYQGLDGDKSKNGSNILLTDTEIEELIETECMLEQYDRYYNGE